MLDEIKENDIEHHGIGDMWEHFFSRERKYYNPYMIRLKNHPKYIMYDKKIINSYKGKWNTFFGNSNSIDLEIGSGSGMFANNRCVKQSDRNYLALEIRFKRLVLAAIQTEKIELKNLLFIKSRGEEIADFIAPKEISRVYINFPDPWDKKKKNRIIQPKLFELLNSVLSEDGKFFFKTDHDNYYSDVLDFMPSIKGYKVIYHTNDLHHSKVAKDNIMTEFEHLFIHKHQKNINYIEIQKTETK